MCVLLPLHFCRRKKRNLLPFPCIILTNVLTWLLLLLASIPHLFILVSVCLCLSHLNSLTGLHSTFISGSVFKVDLTEVCVRCCWQILMMFFCLFCITLVWWDEEGASLDAYYFFYICHSFYFCMCIHIIYVHGYVLIRYKVHIRMIMMIIVSKRENVDFFKGKGSEEATFLPPPFLSLTCLKSWYYLWTSGRLTSHFLFWRVANFSFPFVQWCTQRE